MTVAAVASAGYLRRMPAPRHPDALVRHNCVRDHAVDDDPATSILWTLRDTLGMTGIKFGCGATPCGA